MIRLIAPGFLFIALFLSVVRQVDAKSLFASQLTVSASTELYNSNRSIAAIAQFESTLLPYFTARARGVDDSVTYRPTQADYFAIAATWKQLSSQFKSAYAKATEIYPELNHSYRSPGGFFEIFYTTSGTHAVNATDTLGYGPDSLSWRRRTSGANGIPDYVDHIAFGVDSAFSMEVNRFGFPAPYPYRDNSHPSSLYKIAVVHFADLDYGYTIPAPAPENSSLPRFASYIQVRNEWLASAWGIDYQRHPEKPAWVTCAHEFFHSCQFRMLWNIASNGRAYDDYPITWIEGTAVLMEELAFDDINDYVQYSIVYFNDPKNPVLHHLHTGDAYSNSLAVIYFYQRFNSIDFVKNIFIRNYTTLVGFYTNIELTANELSSSWNSLLGDFHSESYFTGNRSSPSRFIKDAADLPLWHYPLDIPNDTGAITKNVRPYGMQTYSFTYDQTQNNSLLVSFYSRDTLASHWSVNAIVRNKTAAHDSLIPLRVQNGGRRDLAIIDWDHYDTIVVVVTNAGADSTRQATVVFDATDIFCEANQAIDTIVFENSAQPDSAHSLAFSILATQSLHGKLVLYHGTLSNKQKSVASAGGFIPLGRPFTIMFPQLWASQADLFASFSLPANIIAEAQRMHVQPAESFKLCYWNDPAQSWDTVSAQLSTSERAGTWRASISMPGMYMVAARYLMSPTITAYPNPVKRAGATTIQGSPALLIREVVIHSLYGNAIAAIRPDRDQSNDIFSIVPYGVQWHSKNTLGTLVAPGTYIARIAFTNGSNTEIQTALKKIMILP